LPNRRASFDHLHEYGWVRIERAVPVERCAAVIEAMRRELGVPVDDPSRWDEYGGLFRDLVPLWGHQAQWDIRQAAEFHAIWAALWGTDRLWVSIDSCRFTPPWRPGHAGPYAIHWDHDPWDPHTRIIQSVLALTDTPAEQGGFCCVPSLFRDRTAWPTAPVGEPGSPGAWRPGVAGREIVAVPARAGDLIVWDWRLPHSNSRNRGARPRLAFYAAMYPTGSEAIRRDAIASRQTGRAPAWMRARPGHDRIEPWPPADLTLLGRPPPRPRRLVRRKLAQGAAVRRISNAQSRPAVTPDYRRLGRPDPPCGCECRGG
jgi:hypothetical protein